MNEGTLPDGWRLLPLRSVSDIIAGIGFPVPLQGRRSGDLPFFKVGDISEAWRSGMPLLRQAQHYISRAEARELRGRALPAGTVVFAKIGAAIALNRRAVLAQPSLVDNNVMGLAPISEVVDPKYLFHFSCTLRLADLSRATTVPSIRKSDVEEIQVPVPPRAEQERIVADIEKQFTRLDAGVAALTRLLAHLRRYRAAVLKAACEGRLVPTEAVLAEAEGCHTESAASLMQRVLADRTEGGAWRSSRVRAPAPPAEVPVRLPPGWVAASLDQCCRRITDGTHQPPKFTESGVPFVFVKHIVGGRLTFTGANRISQEAYEALNARCPVEVGDILYTAVGSYGVAVPVVTPQPFSFQRHIAHIKPSPLLSQAYLVHCLNSPIGLSQAHLRARGVAQKTVTLGDLSQFVMPIPPRAEQDRIVAEVEARLSNLDAMESAVETNLLRASRLRSAVLHSAFEGRLARTELAPAPPPGA